MSRSRTRYARPAGELSTGALIVSVPEAFVRRAAARLERQGTSGLAALGVLVRAMVRRLASGGKKGRPTKCLKIKGKTRIVRSL